MRWPIVYFLNLICSKNSLTKLVGYQQPTCLCVKMEFMVGTISLSRGLYSLSWSCCRSCGVDTIVYEKWCFVSHAQCCGSCMVSTIAQNIRHSSNACVNASTMAFRCLHCSGSQPFLMHSSLGSLWNFSFLPYYTISAGRLKKLKSKFCDDSDRTLWVEV